MADLTVSFKLPEAKIDNYVAYYVRIHPNDETVDDPTWNDPQDGSVTPQLPKYTDKQWVREHIIRTVRYAVVGGRNEKERDKISAYNADDIS